MKIKDFKELNISIISYSSFDGEHFSNTGEPEIIECNNKYGLKSIFFSFLNNKENLLMFNEYFGLALSVRDDVSVLKEYEINVILPAEDSYRGIIVKFDISSPNGKSIEFNIENLGKHILEVVKSTTRENGVEVIEKENLRASYEEQLDVIISF
ncbi:MAG: hypothetical protein GX913_00890 [Clostridiales bacterium]|nr:hypothetical protein [Clostridiales bacterium]